MSALLIMLFFWRLSVHGLDGQKVHRQQPLNDMQQGSYGLGSWETKCIFRGHLWEAEAPPSSMLNRDWETTALCREMIPPIRWLAASCFCERQFLSALAEFLTARLTSNLGKKNTIWHLNFEKLPNLDLLSESSPGNHGNYLPRTALQSVNKAHVS